MVWWLELRRVAFGLRSRLVGQVITGFWLSVTVTVKVQALVLPLASVAVLVTVVVPTGKVLPLGGVLARLVTLKLSVTLTLKATLLRLHRPAPAARTTLPRQLLTAL